MKKYVFDLDNTLIYTDALNSEAYNYALVELGREPITNMQRITREKVFAEYEFTDREKEKILKLKQNYFCSNLHKAHENEELMSVLQCARPENCILWTSAERCRVKAVLDYFKLNKAFSFIFYSSKSDINNDVKVICERLSCRGKELIFYENDCKILDKVNHALTALDN